MAEYYPYDEDDNLSDRLHCYDEYRDDRNDFIQSTCMISEDSIEINGTDLNVKLTVVIFEQIHRRLWHINRHQLHPKNSDTSTEHDDTEHNAAASASAVFDIGDSLAEMKSSLVSFRLLYVSITPRILILIYKILALSQSTLTELQLELLMPLQASIDQHATVNIIGTFDKIMRVCCSLPALNTIGIDLVNFPLECYTFFTHFRNVDSSFLSLKSLQIFLCQEHISNQQQNLQALLSFLDTHETLEALRIVINDGDENMWEELQSMPVAHHRFTVDGHRFKLSTADKRALNAMCRQIIDCLNASSRRRRTLTAFSLCHYLGDDVERHLDILQALVSSHPHLCELSLAFECMSDIALSKLICVMHQNLELMQNLEFIDFECGTCGLDEFCFVSPSQIAHRMAHDEDVEDEEDEGKEEDDEHDDEDDEDEDEDKDDDDEDDDDTCVVRSSSKRSIKQSHFGRDSLLQCAQLLDKCPSLIQLHLKCVFGVDLDAFRRLTESIVCHSNLQQLSVHNLQRTNDIFECLIRMMAHKQHSFMDTLSVTFNRHYLDTLRREKYTIPDSMMQSLNNNSSSSSSSSSQEEEDTWEKQLRPNCETQTVLRFADALLASQHHLWRYMQSLRQCLSVKWLNVMVVPNDVLDIVMDFLVYNQRDDEENVFCVDLHGLPNDLRSSLKSYFTRRFKEQSQEVKENMHRVIRLNKHLFGGAAATADHVDAESEDDDESDSDEEYEESSMTDIE